MALNTVLPPPMPGVGPMELVRSEVTKPVFAGNVALLWRMLIELGESTDHASLGSLAGLTLEESRG